MQIATFDTYKIIKRLEGKGASTDLAQEIVQAIQEGRTQELSALVSKNDFYDNIESEISLIKEDIEVYASHLEAKIQESQNTNIKWMIGLFSPLYIGTLVLIIRFFITGN